MAQKPVLGKGLASLLPAAGAANSPTVTSQAAFTGGSAGHAGATAAGAKSAGEAPGVSTAPGAAGASATASPTDSSNRDRHPGISLISIDEIQANHFQPRRDFDDDSLEELAQSIRTSGIIQPLIVRKTSAGKVELIAGERRLRAAMRAGLKQVPIVIRRSTDRETLEIALIENIQRQNLNCIDEALAYFQLIQDFSLTQEEVAERVGKDRATVANFLRLLRLPELIIEDLRKQILSFGHGKALLGLADADQRLRARNQIIEKRLSVRETEALVDMLKKPKGSLPVGPTSSDDSPLAKRIRNLSHELTRHWSTKVEIKGSEQLGKIVIHYSSREDLDRILEGMQTTKV